MGNHNRCVGFVSQKPGCGKISFKPCFSGQQKGFGCLSDSEQARPASEVRYENKAETGCALTNSRG